MLNKAETRLVTVYTRAIRYQASSSNYRRLSASLFEMRSLTVNDNTLCQMVGADFIRPGDAGSSDKGRISCRGLAGRPRVVVADRRVSISRRSPSPAGCWVERWGSGETR